MIAAITLCLSIQAAAPVLDEFDIHSLIAHPGLESGDFDQVREDWLRELEARPDSHVARSVVRQIQRLGSRCSTQLDPARLDALWRSVADPEARLALQHMLHARARELRFTDTPLSLPDDLYADVGRQWELAGPVGSMRDPAPMFQLPLGDLSEWAGFDELEWRALERAPKSYMLAPGNHIYPNQGGLAFLRARMPLERGRELLEVECSDRFRAYWNGQLVLENRGEGAHVQTRRFHHDLSSDPRPPEGESESENELLIVVELGTGVGVAARVHSHYPSSWGLDAPRAAQHVLGMLDAVMLGRADHALAEPEPDDATLLAPYLRARHIALGAAAYLSSEVRRRLELEVEARLDELDIRYPEVEARRILRELSEDRPLEALQRARALAESRPDDPMLARNAILPLLALDVRGSLARPALLAHLQRFPDDSEVALILADQSLQRGDHPRALDYAWRALTSDGGGGGRALDLVLQLAELAGGERLVQFEAALEAWRLDETGARRPESLLVELWQRSGRDAELEAFLRARLAEDPELPSRSTGLASFLIERGRADEAEAHLRHVLELVPGASGPARTLALLGAPDPAEQFFAAWAHDSEEAIAAARAQAGARSDSLLEALDAAHVYVTADGSAHWRTHTITLVANRRGTDELPQSPVLGEARVARVLKADGATLEPAQLDGSWVWPDLEPNDAVELVWDRYDYSYPGEAPQLGSWHFASFSKPFVRSRLVVFLPEGVAGEWREFKFEGAHTTHAWGGGTVHVWSTDDQARREEEPARPSYEEILPWISYGADLPLEYRVHAARRTLNSSCRLSAELERELGPLVAERLAGASGLERARRLYAWVEEHLLEFEFGGDAVDAWTTRRGDPQVLYAALLGLAGVDYDWALLERSIAPELDPEPLVAFRGQREYELPCLRLRALEPGGEATWIAIPPGARGTAFGSISSRLAGARALLLLDAGLSEETTLPRDALADAWGADLELELELDARGGAFVRGLLRISAAQGAVMREQLSQIEPAQRAAAARSLAAQNVPGMDLQRWEFPGLELAGASFAMSFEGHLPGYLRARGERHEASLRMPGLGLASGLGPAEREYPLVLRTDLRNRMRVSLIPGDNWQLEGGPEPFEELREGFQYSLTRQTAEEGVLHYERVLVLRGLEILPAEVPAFLERLGQLEREELRAVRAIGGP